MAIPVWQPSTLYPNGYIVRSTADLQGGDQNDVNDGGFESGTLDDWTYEVFGGSQTAYVTPTNARTGLYAFYWPGGSGTGNEGGIECLATSDDAQPVNDGLSVTAKGWFRYNTTGDIDGSQARMFLQWYDASMVPTRRSTGSLIKGRGNNNRWVQSTVTDLAQAGDSFVAAQFWVTGRGGKGHVYADDITWDYTTPDPPEGLVFRAVQPGVGTSDATEPTWPTVNGLQVVDGSVTWEALVASRITYRAIPILKSGATEPTWTTSIGESVADNTISWQASTRQVVEAPNSKVVAITASKVFAADGDIIKFSATVNPLDWGTADDAGYLPSGLNQNGSNDTAVLNIYRSALVSFSSTTFQNWQVDPDPANMSLLDVMEGIGSTWQQAAQPVAKDLFYLSQLGVRTVGISAGSNNLTNGDVGMPVDPIVRVAMRVATENGSDAIGLYYPSLGQYWLTFSDFPPGPLSISGDFPNFWGQGVEAEYQYGSSGGWPPRTFSITGGSLPPGMSLSASGEITGSSSVIGTYSWEVTVTDQQGGTSSLDDGTTISEVPSLIGVAPDAGIGIPYDGFTYSGSGGTGPYTYSIISGSLPAGLGPMTTAGEIPAGGVPTEVGEFPYVVRITDSLGVYSDGPDSIGVGTGIVAMMETASVSSYDYTHAVGTDWPFPYVAEDLLVLKSGIVSSVDHHIYYGRNLRPCRSLPDGTGFEESTGASQSGSGGQREGSRNPITGTVILPQGVSNAAIRSTDDGLTYATCGISDASTVMCFPHNGGHRWFATLGPDGLFRTSDNDGVSSASLGSFTGLISPGDSVCSHAFPDIQLGFVGGTLSSTPRILSTTGGMPVAETIASPDGVRTAGIRCGSLSGTRYAFAWTDTGQLLSRDMDTGVWSETADQPDGVPVGIAFAYSSIQMAVHKDNVSDNEAIIYEINPDGTLTELRRDVLANTSAIIAISACVSQT